MEITSEQLALEFSKVLRQWLTPDQMKSVVELNQGETHPSVCHSGDFCMVCVKAC